ncbi:MAG: L,D-transpeptidase family protein [Candidatus Hydrogenedentes bacterium]|nr:L,D-transpeptidase family protein [Candidatus Hydrogenedentota bacterium]
MKKFAVGLLVLIILAGIVSGLGYMVRQRAAKEAEQQYYLGQSFLEKNDDARAREAFKTLLEQSPRSRFAEPAISQLAMIAERAKEFDKALGYWTRLESNFPMSSRSEEIKYHKGYCLENLKRYDDAREMYMAATEGSQFYVPSRCGLGRIEEASGRLLDARDIYRDAVKASVAGTDDYKEAVELLGNINVRLLFSKAKTPESILYRVKPGDSISSIGSKFSVTKASILRANGLQPDTPLRVNWSLKITPFEYKVVIDMSDFRMQVFANDQLFKEYDVGLGRPDSPTTPGKYVIGNKIVNPTWYSPKGKVYPPGDPENELGTRWMGLQPLEPNLPTDLGIHSTIHPNTVGWASSSGCPRMRPADAEELFDILPLRTPVLIKE